MDVADIDVSVVVPTFNRSALLGRALASVAAQTVPVREVIVVDDGSNDGSETVVERSALAARYFWQPNRGVSAARNVGIREALSSWIAFLDSDDEWRPQKLEKQLEGVSRAPQFRVCHTEETWIRNGQRVNPRRRHRKRGGRMFRACLPLCAISPSSVLIHRSVFEDVGTFDEELPACEDYDLWLRICSRYPVLLIDEPLIVKYGGHADQLSRGWGLDRFRIVALERVLAGAALDPADELAARETLVKKLSVYLAGARRRGRAEEVQRLEARRRHHRELIERDLAGRVEILTPTPARDTGP